MRPILVVPSAGSVRSASQDDTCFRVHCPVPGPSRSDPPEPCSGTVEKVCGDHSQGETPGPIPNPEAKALHGDGTALERVWESSASPLHTSWGFPSSIGSGNPHFLFFPRFPFLISRGSPYPGAFPAPFPPPRGSTRASRNDAGAEALFLGRISRNPFGGVGTRGFRRSFAIVSIPRQGHLIVQFPLESRRPMPWNNNKAEVS